MKTKFCFVLIAAVFVCSSCKPGRFPRTPQGIVVEIHPLVIKDEERIWTLDEQGRFFRGGEMAAQVLSDGTLLDPEGKTLATLQPDGVVILELPLPMNTEASSVFRIDSRSAWENDCPLVHIERKNILKVGEYGVPFHITGPREGFPALLYVFLVIEVRGRDHYTPLPQPPKY